jgi:hypothetical protein
MGQHTIKGKDGSTLELNFTYDNGLPTKPIINPAYQAMYSENTKQYALYIYLDEEDLKDLGEIIIEGYLSKNNNDKSEVWLFIKDVYLVLGNLSAKIIEELKNKQLAFCFFKDDKTFIKGIKLE